MSKHKILGRIAFGLEPSKSKIYWKCPTRKCKDIHYFPYSRAISSGSMPVYQMTCIACGRSYLAEQINTTGSTAMLAASFDDEDTNGTS